MFENPLITSFLKTMYTRCPVCKKRLIDTIVFRHASYTWTEKCDLCDTIAVKLKNPTLEILAEITGMQVEELYNELKDEGFAKILIAEVKGILDYGVRVPLCFPGSVSWEITYKCNLKCLHCYVESPRVVDELSTDEALKVVRDIAEMGFVTVALSGGEPLLRRDIIQIASELYQYGVNPVIVTNGTLLTRETVTKLAKAGVKHVQISIDSFNEEVHDWFRGGKGVLHRALEGLCNCVENGIDVVINCVVARFNYKELSRFLKLAYKHGAKAVNFIPLIPLGRILEHRKDFELNMKEYLEISSSLMRLREEVPIDVTFEYPQIPSPSILERLDLKATMLIGGCNAALSRCNITADGYVQPCNVLRVNAGNIRRESLKDIWTESPIFNDLRDRSKLRGKCSKCKYKHLCGGCRGRAYAVFGDYLAEDPYCPLTWA